MACAGCERRKAWLKKWLKIAYERSTGKRSADGDKSANGGADSADRSDKSPG